MRVIVAMILIILIPACAGRQPSGRHAAKVDEGFQDLYVPSGTSSPAMNMGFEVSYDARLDNLVPGYKILTVAITNNSLEYLQMDSLADRWWVVDRNKSKQNAILMLRNVNPTVWGKLPLRLRQMLEYPLLVRIADSATVDLLFPMTVHLSEFREVVFRSANRQKLIHIIPRE